MPIIQKIHQYSVAKKIINKLAFGQDPFTIDTNIIIVLAENKDIVCLNNILGKFSKFQLTKANIRELDGLIRSRTFNPAVTKIIDDWLNRAKKRQYVDIDITQRVNELKEFSLLIPRKLAHDIVVNLPDSYLNKLIELYKWAMEQDKEPSSRELVKKVNELKRQLPEKARERFAELSQDILQYQIDQNEYWADVEHFIDASVKDIEIQTGKAISESRGSSFSPLDTIISTLQAIASKQYERDVEFVAETIERGYIGESLDNDVIWLFRLNAARKVA